jgi:hypothetical protein
LQPALEGLIVPSKFYGIAAAGRSVIYIGDPEGEIPRILHEERCGYVVTIRNAEGLANYIKDLSVELSKSYDMGRKARSAFKKRFDKILALNEWEMLIRRCA